MFRMPRPGVSNEYPKHMFFGEIKKNICLILPLIWIYESVQKLCSCTPDKEITDYTLR